MWKNLWTNSHKENKIILFRVLLLIILICISLNAATISELKSHYSNLKIEYLKAVLKSDKEQERKQLEQLIATGSKIGENTSKYKSELAKLKPVQAKKTVTKPAVTQKQKSYT